MGKRSSFKRRPQDAYDTPIEAVLPLLPHLPEKPFNYCEPCAGAGALIEAMPERSAAFTAYDLEPRRDWIDKFDALLIDDFDVHGASLIITNPPWTRSILHPMIERFSDLRPTWLLFDADWMHTKQATPYLERCRKIVSVGRVKWIPDSPHTGKDNACWYLFDNTGTYKATDVGPVFIGRKEKAPVSDSRPEALRGFQNTVTVAERKSSVNGLSTVSASRQPNAEETKGRAMLTPCTPRLGASSDV